MLPTLMQLSIAAGGNFRVPRHLAIAFNQNHVIELQRSGRVNTDLFIQFSQAVKWSFVSRFICLTEDEIEQMQDFVDWPLICQYQTLSEQFMENVVSRHVQLSNLPYLNQKMSVDFVLRNSLPPFLIPTNDLKPMEVIRLYNEQKIHIERVIKYQPYISEQILLDHIPRAELKNARESFLATRRMYSDEFLSHILEPWKWGERSFDHVILSETQIRRMEADWTPFIWSRVLRNNKLSKKLILEFQNSIIAVAILATQDLDDELINWCRPRMSVTSLRIFSHDARDLERLEMFPEFWNAETVSRRRDLTFDFCVRHMDRLISKELYCRNFPHEFFETFRGKLSDAQIGLYAPQTYIEAHFTPAIHRFILEDFGRFSLRFIFDHLQ